MTIRRAMGVLPIPARLELGGSVTDGEGDGEDAGDRPPSLLRRLSGIDLIALALLAAGLLSVVTGLLPSADASATVKRILPLLVFLGSVIILAELAARAELFDVIAVRLAIIGRG